MKKAARTSLRLARLNEDAYTGVYSRLVNRDNEDLRAKVSVERLSRRRLHELSRGKAEKQNWQRSPKLFHRPPTSQDKYFFYRKPYTTRDVCTSIYLWRVM